MSPGRKDKKPPSKAFPTTIEAALDFLDSHSDPEVLSLMRDLPADRLIEAYRDYGIHIRSMLGLWGQNPELIACIPENHRFADAASAFIIDKWHARLCNK